MARKTFISYKYSEAQGLRDRIIAKLGSGAQYYRGENGFSNDLSSYTASTIKGHLSDMIYGTSVTIVILSPNMSASRWIPWEIEYSLSEFTRNDRTSRTNGILCVVQKQPTYAYDDGYGWLKNWQGNWEETKIFSIIKSNLNNKKTWQQSPIPANNKSLYDTLSQNYIDIVTESSFLYNPDKYIEDAFIRSQNVDSYNVTKKANEWGGFYY
jgi:hypothetical protein